MAKKKRKKKHNFQHNNVSQPAVASVNASASIKSTPANTSSMPNEWGEVADDVRRALILAGVFILIMIALWYFLDVSTFGKNLYNSIKL